jgi:hypothetical protein
MDYHQVLDPAAQILRNFQCIIRAAVLHHNDLCAERLGLKKGINLFK